MLNEVSESFPKIARLLASLDEAADAARLFDSEEITGCRVRRAVFDGCRLTHRFVQSVLFEECTFRDFRMAESHFTDVIFRNCDLSNDFLSGCNFLRVEFIGCRLIGTDFSQGSFRQVGMERCLADYANFSESRFRQFRLHTVMCRDAVFVNCQLDRACFERCDFSRAEFYRTAMKGLDLRNSEIADLRVTSVGSFELRGLRVTSLQALGLARMLGIEIED